MADKYYRLVSLIVNICPLPLRELFHQCAQNDPLFTSPYTEHDYMLFRQSDVRAARNIRRDQYDKIYPRNGGQTDVSDWDITLLATILKLLFVKQISQMSQTILTNIDIIRDTRNNLQHIASTSSVSDTDFIEQWGDIEDATLDLANDIKGSAYKEDIRKEITKAKTSNMPDLGNVLCRWYEEKSLSLESKIDELHTEMKELREKHEKETNKLEESLKIVSENTSSTKTMIFKGSRKHIDNSGRSRKRFKTVDIQQDVMQRKFSETLRHGLPTGDPISFLEVPYITKKLREDHFVVVCGTRNSLYLQAALTSIKDMGYAEDRCFELNNASDWWHITFEEADCIVVLNPFGKLFFDSNKASAMSDIFDSMVSATRDEAYGDVTFRDIVIISEKALLDECKKYFPHELLKSEITILDNSHTLTSKGESSKRFKTADSQQDVMQPLIGQSIDKAFRWSECIIQNDVKTANSLVQRKILPSNSELHKACHEFGRHSETFSNICGMICKQTMDTAEDEVDVWTSYCADEWHLDDKICIVFIVSRTDTSKCIKLEDYKYHFISENTFSNESEEVLAMELSDETSDISSTRDTVQKMRKCIARYADDLLERHSNISVVLPSLKRSVGYNSAKHTILDEPCIVLYVPVKGYIPIDEDPFPQEIGGFKVDVLEGKFESYGGGPNEFHEHLKIGLAIHANIRDNNKHLLGGTLGGFLNHPVYKMCGLTCAHVVCSNEEMGCLNLQGFENGLYKPVFQPVTQESDSFGRVVRAVYNDGDEHTSGMEVALFNIQERHPKDGSFPLAFNNIQAGFDENNPMTYNSGAVCEASAISPRTEVYKYGVTTGITRGSFALQGAVVRKDRMEGRTGSFGYSLKNQLVVLQIGVDPFAEAGDSGALVLMKGDQHDSIAIGIVEGGIKGRVFVTPICDILRAFGCSDIKMHTFNTVEKCPASTGVVMDVSESMDINDK